MPISADKKLCLFTKYFLTVSFFMPRTRIVTKIDMKYYNRNLSSLQKCLKHTEKNDNLVNLVKAFITFFYG